MRRFLFIAVSLLILFSAMAGFTLYRNLLIPLAPPTAAVVEVPPGASLHQVARQLESAGVVRSGLSLRLLARWHKQGGRIQAGTYRFQEAAKPSEILERLIQGDVEKVSLTIPEGFTLKQVIDRISAAGYGNAQRLAGLAGDPAFISTLKLDTTSLEGYLFPETYLFAPGITEKALLGMMVSQFHRHISGELLAAAKKQGLNLHQLVTLASIIEKETGQQDEMPLISSVFHNRLQRRIPLQTDPTVIYGIPGFDGNLTRKHLMTPGPYNTYLNRGLPPGPIANPGMSALQAAAHPADTRYLYFVARGDGSHEFSTTLKQHNAAVRKYQLHRRNR